MYSLYREFILNGGNYMLKEFKEFAMKGNVIDLAVGVIIGGAFQKIVSSLVEDIIMPLISIPTGKVDFTDLYFTIGNTPIKYGALLTTVMDFILVAFALFLFVKYINHLNKKLEQAKLDELAGKIPAAKLFKKKKKSEPEPEPTTKVCPYCVSEISIKATRCPHCTSVLEEAKKMVEEVTEVAPETK